MARCLLDSAEIPYAVTSDYVEDLFGWGRLGSTHNFATGPAEVVVNRNDAETARELLSDLAGYLPPWRPLWLRWFARVNLLLSVVVIVQPIISWFHRMPRHIHLH